MGALNSMALVLSPLDEPDSSLFDFDDFEGKGSFDDLPLHRIDRPVVSQDWLLDDAATKRVADLQEQLRAAQEQLREAKRLADRMAISAETSRLEVENLRKENKELKSQSLSIQIDAARKRAEEANHHIEVAANTQHVVIMHLHAKVDRQSRELCEKSHRIQQLETVCENATARIRTNAAEYTAVRQQLRQMETDAAAASGYLNRVVASYNAERSLRATVCDEVVYLKARLQTVAHTMPIPRQHSDSELFAAKKRSASAMLEASSAN